MATQVISGDPLLFASSLTDATRIKATEAVQPKW